MVFKQTLSDGFSKRIEFLKKDPLGIYEQSPDRIREDFGTEEAVLGGGYSYRQVTELIQNGADAISEYCNENSLSHFDNALIKVVLTKTHLYVGNTGAPLAEEGLNALLRANSSSKRGAEIGRFGLGFKSLLRLGGKVEVYSATNGNIYFDPLRCKEELCKRYNVDDAPGLRLVWPLPVIDEADELISGFGTWVETLVRAEIKTDGYVEKLKDEIRKFQSEFLIFLPVSVKIVFIDLTDEKEFIRELKVADEGNNRKILSDGNENSKWFCFKEIVQVTDERAIIDATHIHNRKKIPIAWAYPAEGRSQTTGRFWAFFHTETESRIAGIINAPWKLNTDRTALVPGDWNNALMQKSAELISRELPRVFNSDDPGSILNAFPRQVDNQEEIAFPLVESVWENIISTEIMPNGNGVLNHPNELFLPPIRDTERVKAWFDIAPMEIKAKYVHPSCLGHRERESRLDECLRRIDAANKEKGIDPQKVVDNKTWIEAIADIEILKAKKVLQLAYDCKEILTAQKWESIKENLVIIPSADGKTLLAGKDAYIQADITEKVSSITNRKPVASEIIENIIMRKILKELGVKEPDDSLWEESLKKLLPQNGTGEWESFWDTLRKCPQPVMEKFIDKNRDNICIKRNDSEWVAYYDALMPGGWVNEDDQENKKWLVDLKFHNNDMDVLEILGTKKEYTDKIVRIKQTDEILKDWLEYYKSTTESWRRWSDSNGEYSIPSSVLWLLHLEAGSKSVTTLSALFQIILDTKNNFINAVYMGYYHQDRRRSYQYCQAINPSLWLLQKHGTIIIGENTFPIECLIYKKDSKSLKYISNWEKIKPVFDKFKPKVEPTITPNNLSTLWHEITLISLNHHKNVFDIELYDLWEESGNDNYVPEILPAGENRSLIPISKINITSSTKEYNEAFKNGIKVIQLSHDIAEKWLKAGAHRVSLEKEIKTENEGDEIDILDVIPEMKKYLRPEKTYYPCKMMDRIILSINNNSEEQCCLADDEGILLLTRELSKLTLKERLEKVLPIITEMGWCVCSVEEIEKLIEDILDSSTADKRKKVRECESIPTRLLEAIGSNSLSEKLKQRIDEEIIGEVNNPLKLTEIALSQYGTAILSEYREALESNGLKPPSRWNTDEARRFVLEIGLPIEFSTSSQQRREAEEIISGPIKLPPLHDFQEEVMHGISELVEKNKYRRRAVVSLPTGGGKTRVTVQSAVELILKPVKEKRSVIWIAQTDELCEQAVQAFRQVWINIGAENEDLRIIRLWGGQRNPESQPSEKPVVVVASIQTLNNRFEELNWLSTPGLVVFDECHHAITKSYTNILRGLDIDSAKTQKTQQEEPPIIGLSATPFRTNDEESERLAKRFNKTWFPADQSNLYQKLLADGVLAKTRTNAIDSNIGLTPEEEQILDKLSEKDELDKPAGFNALVAIDDRFADIQERNNLIVNRIKDALLSGEAASILLYANSVNHSRKLAGLLTLADIPAASIDGETPKNARRYFLKDFHQGKIKVLCNHSVLTTGFDAPKTDMILISRMIFSPVMYMQIVGRGLRGPKNGGTPECLLVTIKDNIGRFADKYAYHYCEDYFNKMK